jgi:hypothetical protein
MAGVDPRPYTWVLATAEFADVLAPLVLARGAGCALVTLPSISMTAGPAR